MSPAKKSPIPVRPGQIWADADPRGYGRKVRIIDLDVSRATVEPVLGGRRTRILHDENGLRGYRLVTDLESGDA